MFLSKRSLSTKSYRLQAVAFTAAYPFGVGNWEKREIGTCLVVLLETPWHGYFPFLSIFLSAGLKAGVFPRPPFIGPCCSDCCYRQMELHLLPRVLKPKGNFRTKGINKVTPHETTRATARVLFKAKWQFYRGKPMISALSVLVLRDSLGQLLQFSGLSFVTVSSLEVALFVVLP